jgi:cation transport ATPase
MKAIVGEEIMTNEEPLNRIDEQAESEKEKTRHLSYLAIRGLRAIALLIMFLSFFGPWGIDMDTYSVYHGWAMMVYTFGACIPPFLLLFITGLLVVFSPRRLSLMLFRLILMASVLLLTWSYLPCLSPNSQCSLNMAVEWGVIMFEAGLLLAFFVEIGVMVRGRSLWN